MLEKIPMKIYYIENTDLLLYECREAEGHIIVVPGYVNRIALGLTALLT